MPLTLVTGRANAGKSRVLDEALREAACAGREGTLCLPAYPDVVRARRAYAARGPALGVTVTTLDSWAAALWAIRGDGRALVTAAQRNALVRRALASAGGESLAAVAQRPGTVGLVSRVALAMDGQPERVPASGVATGILGALRAYRNALSREGLMEPAEAWRVLGDTCEERWFPGPVCLAHFTDLSAAQERLILSAAAARADVLVAITWEEGFAPTRASDGLVERLRPGARMIEVGGGAHTPSVELTYVASHMFLERVRAPGVPADGDVRLSVAEGAEAESDRVAGELLRAIDDGFEPAHIAVVYRRPAEHAGALRRALAEAGVSAEFDVPVFARDTGLGRAIAHLMGAATESGWTRLSAFLRAPHSGVDPDSADALDRRWRRAGCGPGRSLADIRRVSESAAALVRASRQLAGRQVDGGTLARWQDMATRLLVNALGRGAPRAAGSDALDAAAHAALIRAIEQAAALSEGTSVDELLESFGATEVATGEGEGRGVLVTAAERVRGRRFDVVVIGGLTAADFAPKAAPDALEAGGVAEVLVRAGLPAPRADEDDVERLLFYTVCTRAARRLVLSRQVADAEGRPVRPSALLEEFLDMYRAPGAEVGAGGPPCGALGAGDLALGPAGAPPTRRRAWRTLASGGPRVRDGEGQRRARAVRRRIGPRGSLTSEEILTTLASREVFSATEIDTYVRCPYRWFHGHVLGPRPVDTPLDAPARGAVVHDALCAFYRTLPAELGMPRIDGSLSPEMVEVADRCVDDAVARLAAPRSVAEEVVLARARRSVLGFLGQDASFLPGFAPINLEWGFEGAEDNAAFEGFSLAGRIDRVDADAGGRLFVQDYKTGALGGGHSWSRGTERGNMQVLLYAEVARRRLGGGLAGAVYRRVCPTNVAERQNRGVYLSEFAGTPGLSERVDDAVGAEGLERAIRGAVEAASGAVAGMRAGRIAPEPARPECCRGCACARYCGTGAG